MSMNTDAIIAGMNSVEALTMATKCIAKLDLEQTQTLLDVGRARCEEVHVAETEAVEDEVNEDSSDEKEQ